MTMWLTRSLAPGLLLVTACSGGSSGSSADSPSAVAGCAPRTVTFETTDDARLPMTPVLPDGDAALTAAVADSFCSTKWGFVLPDGTEQAVAARAVLAADDAACVAGRLVEEVGAARVTEFGLGAGPWSLIGFALAGNAGEHQIQRAEAEAIVEVFEDCSDQWKRLLILSVTEGADTISDESAACVADRLSDDEARSTLVAEIDRAYDDPTQTDAQPFPDDVEQLIAAYDDCLSPTEQGALDFN